MATVSFDGSAKIIEVTTAPVSGLVTVDFQQDIYSAWKDWIAAGNAQYPQAMRSVGGDPISDVKTLGATYFILNGWKIKPYAADHRMILEGNVYSDPAGESVLVGVPGYSIMVEYAVSNLVDSTLAQIEEIEQSAFNNVVTLDVVNGTDATAYPVGTPATPCKTWANVIAIGAARGFKAVSVLGDWTVGATDNLTEWHVYGEGATLNATRTKITFTSGNVTTGAHFHNCRIVGPQGGETNYHECIIEALSNSHCHYERCGFLAPSSQTYTVQHSSTIGLGHITDLHSCYGDEGTAIVDRNGTRLNQRYMDFSGNIRFQNQNRATDSGSIWIHLAGGTVTIDSTCTTGSFFVSGIGSVVNNGTSTVDATQLMSAAAAGDPWASVIEGTYTAAEVLRIMAAALAGTSNKVGNTITFKGIDGTTDRIVGSFDAENNRTGAVLDGG